MKGFNSTLIFDTQFVVTTSADSDTTNFKTSVRSGSGLSKYVPVSNIYKKIRCEHKFDATSDLEQRALPNTNDRRT